MIRAVFYFDSSALVKKYLPEVGSDWIDNICSDPNNACILSELGTIEIETTFSRKRREKVISEEEHQHISILFSNDCKNKYRVDPFTQFVRELAIDFVKRHPLKAYDAVQLATAHSFNSLLSVIGSTSLTFLSADNQLLRAARNEGLQTDNPNDH